MFGKGQLISHFSGFFIYPSIWCKWDDFSFKKSFDTSIEGERYNFRISKVRICFSFDRRSKRIFFGDIRSNFLSSAAFKPHFRAKAFQFERSISEGKELIARSNCTRSSAFLILYLAPFYWVQPSA